MVLYKMLLITLAISLFSILKVNTLECLSVINQKCMPRPKILDVNEGVGEALFYPYNVLVDKCSGSCVCVCVFIPFHREGFFRLQDV